MPKFAARARAGLSLAHMLLRSCLCILSWRRPRVFMLWKWFHYEINIQWIYGSIAGRFFELLETVVLSYAPQSLTQTNLSYVALINKPIAGVHFWLSRKMMQFKSNDSSYFAMAGMCSENDSNAYATLRLSKISFKFKATEYQKSPSNSVIIMRLRRFENVQDASHTELSLRCGTLG